MISMQAILSNYGKLFVAKQTPPVKHLRTESDDDSVTFYGAAKGSKGTYKVSWTLYKDRQGNVSASCDAKCACDCPAFTYYVNEPLKKIGSTDVTVSKATGDKENNPRNIAAPCKHLYAYGLHIISKGVVRQANP